MFKNWINLITFDCVVYEFGDIGPVYPMFKNASTSLQAHAHQTGARVIINEDISKLSNINVYLRDPIERFVSGVHTYMELEKIVDQQKVLKDIESNHVYNRHFVPQFIWLMHLCKFYRKKIIIRNVSDLYDLIPYRLSPKIKELSDARKKMIQSIDNSAYTNVDKLILESYIGKSVELEKLIGENRHALS